MKTLRIAADLTAIALIVGLLYWVSLEARANMRLAEQVAFHKRQSDRWYKELNETMEKLLDCQWNKK